MTTDYPSTFEEHSMIKMVGFDMAKNAAKKLYEQTGIGPDDVDTWVRPNEIAGIEVYTGDMVPIEFQRGLSGCGSIVIWTK